MQHVRNRRSKIPKGSWRVIDDYTGFTEWSKDLVPDRYGFMTRPELADPLMPEDFPPPIIKELYPEYVRAPGPMRYSDSASAIYDDLSWNLVNQDWDVLDKNWEQSITEDDIEDETY